MKKFFSGLILIAIFMNSSSIQMYAESPSNTTQEEDSQLTIGEIGGYLEGNIKTVKNLTAERKFNYAQGHGFSAERGNNLIDVLKGKNAVVVGDDNAKNGADRKIINRNGTVTLIQDKYYSTASKSVTAAFDDKTGLYRYIDGKGKPMQLEVPADQYDKAVEAMMKNIEEGKVPGVKNSQEAYNIVKKGNLTYQQAVNITKAGNIDSLRYDAANGTITALGAMGISFVLDFALCKLNGQDTKEALKNATLNGLKTGGVIFATYVISSQLAKTGLPMAMAPMTEAIANNLGKGLSQAILQAGGTEVAELTSEQITSRVSNILQNQIIVYGILVIALSADDVTNLFRGRISKKQLLINLTAIIAAAGGMYAGSIAGATVGSFIAPGIGTAAGKIVGGIAGGAAAKLGADKVMGFFFKSDSEEMYEIISDKFETMSGDYLIDMDEANGLVDDLKNELSGSVLKDMYQSDNRAQFAEDLMKPLFEAKVASREEINIPTEEEARKEMVRMFNGIVFMH